MGLFDRSTTTQQNEQNINETSIGVSDVGGGVGYAGGNVTLTDAGAISDALAFATKEANGQALLTSQQIDSATKLGLGAAKAAGDSSRIALDFASENQRGLFALVGALADSTADTARRSNEVLAGAIQSAGDATRSDSAAVLSQITKYGTYAVIAIAAVFLLSKTKVFA